jgi:apolipoprotein N-acyltransferase
MDPAIIAVVESSPIHDCFPSAIGYYLRMLRTITVILAAVIPAVMWSFSLSPSWTMVISLMALWTAVSGLSARRAFHFGTLYGFVLYGVSLSWLWQIFSVPAVALWLILALFCGIACGVIGWLSPRIHHAPWYPLWVAAVWSSIEFYRCEWFVLRFPWMTSGTAMGPIGLTPWIGVYGVSFLVAWLAAELRPRSRPKRRIVMLLLIGGALAWPLAEEPMAEKQGIPVLAVQSENCDFFSYLERSQASDISGGIILWPEYATFEDVSTLRTGPQQTTGLELLRQLARDKKSVIVLGQKRREGDIESNESVVIDETGLLGKHVKNRPVHFMNDGIAGRTAEPIDTPRGKLATPICFDNDYTEVARRMATAGAQLFLAPSMDAEHWSPRQHRQHGELFRLRAAETGRWYVVCATSGLTQVISPDGRRCGSLPLMEDGELRTTVQVKSELTPYLRFGWLLPYGISAVALLSVVWLWRKR